MGRGGNNTITAPAPARSEQQQLAVDEAQENWGVLSREYSLKKGQETLFHVQVETFEDEPVEEYRLRARKTYRQAMSNLIDEKEIQIGTGTDKKQAVDWFLKERNFDWFQYVVACDKQSTIHQVEGGMVLENHPQYNAVEQKVTRSNKVIGKQASARYAAEFGRVEGEFWKDNFTNDMMTSAGYKAGRQRIQSDSEKMADLQRRRSEVARIENILNLFRR